MVILNFTAKGSKSHCYFDYMALHFDLDLKNSKLIFSQDTKWLYCKCKPIFSQDTKMAFSLTVHLNVIFGPSLYHCAKHSDVLFSNIFLEDNSRCPLGMLTLTHPIQLVPREDYAGNSL